MDEKPKTPKKAKTKRRGVEKMYAKLVEQWGREIANEIMLKRARSGGDYDLSKPKKKKGPDLLGARWARVSGSFESGKRR